MPLMKNKILSWPCIANRKMSFDRIIQSLQDTDPNIQQVKKIDLRFQESNEIPEITIDNHRRDLLDSETTECIIQSEQNRVGFQNSVSKCMNQAEGFCPCRYNDSLQSMCKISATYIWNLNWGEDVSMDCSTAKSGNVDSMRTIESKDAAGTALQIVNQETVKNKSIIQGRP